MIKIKTFNTYNDTIINEFLQQSNGKIVNYNPIVIEYDDEKSNFVDPYKGFNAYRVLEGTVQMSENKPFKKNGEIDYENIVTTNFNTICFGRHGEKLVLLDDFFLVLDDEVYWFCITFKTNHIRERNEPKTFQFQFPKEVWSDVETFIEIYQFEDIFLESKHPKLNYNF